MTGRLVILAIIVSLSLNGFAQHKKIRIDANNESLTSVLLDMRNHYNLQFSYSETQLQPYKITVSKSFDNPEQAITYLLKDLPFHLIVRGNVFIVVPDKKTKKPDKGKKSSQITGQIVEAGSFEPLPFSSISINDQSIMADVTGSFNFSSPTDSSFRVRISHLGYFICDTTLEAGTDRQFKLTPSSKKLAEVLIKDKRI